MSFSTNRLAAERSPYLLQHAHNPVDWFPWGAEALEKAANEDRPIFLSVGYSACHWCHVMERESFENESIAALLNERFVSIKVDREERPDIDEIYMTAVQMMTGSGGWPMSVFLLPDGRPFYGGTYFPPTSRYGRIGFGALLQQLGDAWVNRRNEVEKAAAEAAVEIGRVARQYPMQADGAPIPAGELLMRAVNDCAARYDAVNGGFGGAPKFPPHHALRLLTLAARYGDNDAPRMLLGTLDHMALGGLYDQIGGGFHRYATDDMWLVPHFEKMLYDNALLARVYAEAFDLTGNGGYARIASETCNWLLRDLLDPSGGLQAALDADSEGVEGKYYVWTIAEVSSVLGDEVGAAFAHDFCLSAEGNYRDEATHQLTGANIPHRALGADTPPVPPAFESEMETARLGLLAHRYRRVPAGRDHKVITAWNGLAIGALAVCGRVLKNPVYAAAAAHAADFALNTLRRADGTLQRRYAGGEAGIDGFLDDYALLADGLLDLYETSGDNRYLGAARELAGILRERFWDAADAGFYYTSTDHEALIVRTKDLFDGAAPSANGVAARVLARLAAFPEGAVYAATAAAMLTAYNGLMARAPQGVPTLIEAALLLETLETAPPLAPDKEILPVRLLRVSPSPLEVAPGVSIELVFHLEIADGFHVNGPQPGSEYAIPTTATFATNAPASVGPLVFPAPVIREDGGETLNIYRGTAPLALPVKLSDSGPTGRYFVKVTVGCQPCSETECLPPVTLEELVSLLVL